MRRKDREKSQSFAMEVIKKCSYGVLATVNSDNTPYCIPISPVLINDEVFFHCALEGKKLDNISNNPRVCFTCVGDTKLVPEKYTTEFESAVVNGLCQEVTNDCEKIAALKVICLKYAASNMDAFDKAIKTSLKRTGVYKIKIKSVTGKSKKYS